MLPIFKRAKKRVLFIIFFLLLNACLTFSGFVAYTSDERRACDILTTIMSGSTKYDRIEKAEDLPKNNVETAVKYLESYKKKNRCTTIEKFLIQELMIAFFGGIILLVSKKNNKLKIEF